MILAMIIGLSLHANWTGWTGRGMSVIWKIVNKASIVTRSFVRTHSDLVLYHGGAYYKSYQGAAAIVMALVDVEGVEPIIHDYTTTDMCAFL